MGQFRLEWAGFAGGHWIGGQSVDQPPNSYIGPDAYVGSDGFLAPAPKWAVFDDFADTLCSTAYQVTGAAWVGRANSSRVVVIAYDDGGLLKCTMTDGSTVTTQTATALSAHALNKYTGRPIVAPDTSGFYRAKVAWPATFTHSTLPDFTGVSGSGAYLVVADTEDTSSPFLTCYSMPETCWMLAMWGERMYAVSQVHRNRLYYSARGDWTSWSDYIAIGGDLGPAITAVVPTAQALYIGTTDGWFTLTGIPGDSAYVRRLDVTVGPLSGHAANSQYGVLFARTDRGIILMGERGHQQYAVVRGDYDTRDRPGPVAVGNDVIIAGSEGGLAGSFETIGAGNGPPWSCPENAGVGSWVLEGTQWRRITHPTLTDLGVVDTDLSQRGWCWAQGLGMGANFASAYAVVTVGDPIVTDQPNEHLMILEFKVTPDWYTTQNVPTDSLAADRECTVRLAEMRRPVGGGGAFSGTIKEVRAEIEIGGYAGRDKNVEITVQIHTRGHMHDPPGQDGHLSPPQTWSVPNPQLLGSVYPAEVLADDTGANRTRQWVSLSIASTPGQSFQPVVTLKNCRLRRLVALGEDGGEA